MAIVTTLTFNSTAYDVSDYVMRHSIEIDEQLFNPDNLKPTTNRCDFKLSRSCPYIDELFAWTGDVEVSIVADGVAAFTGYLTDNYGLKITARGASDISLSAEDPGIKKLKTAWVSTGALVTVFAGDKVCDPADTTNSFVHILAGLAGVTLATTLPTISDTVYFSVQDKDRKQYWDILEKVLLDYRHVFYFDASGKLALFALDGLTGTASQYVCTNGTILQKSLGDPGVEIKKRLIQYKEVIVNFDEGETLASATVFRDTTGQGLTDCEIEIAAGGYYPTSCDASTYAYVDYFLEDGREIKAVDSITADFSLDSGITYEMTNLGTSAQIRFHNPTGLARSIRKLKITGANVLAIKADSKVTSTVAGGKKLEYDAAYITELADAQSLANLLRYYYANSGSLYTFRAYAGTLYPSDTLFPSDTLYPLGDIILLGDITRLHDPVWTGLDVNCGIYRKKYVVGKAGATFDAVGIGTINLADAVSIYPIYQPNARPIVGLYPTEKALTNDPAGATPDTVDFDGQYGIYGGQRYVGTTPTTWTLDDAGQTESDVAALVPIYEPAYLGAHLDGVPATAKNGDSYLRYSGASGNENRGVFTYDGTTWTRTTDPIYVYKALVDIVFICQLKDPDGAALYGTEADYGVTSTIETAHIMSAIIDRLRVGDLEIFGTLRSLLMDTINSQAGETINAPTPTYWPGSALVNHCASLADGWHAVDNTSTFDGKNVTHVVKGGGDNTVSYQASDTTVSVDTTSSSTHLMKTITSAVNGSARLYIDHGYTYYGPRPSTIGIIYERIDVYKNGSLIGSDIGWDVSSDGYRTSFFSFSVAVGDVITIYSYTGFSFPGYPLTLYVKNARICPVYNTIGVWNDTDNTARVIGYYAYLTISGNIDITGLSNFATTDYDDYWSGSEFINLFAGKIANFRTLDLSGGTFNGKTCETIYKNGTASITLGFTDDTTLLISTLGYYTYTGSVILPTVEGKILFGDPDAEGQYEFWSHNIPGTTDNIISWRNIKTGKIFSILEIRAPDVTSGDSESTLSLHGVVGDADFVNDKSMHNYSGTMKVVDVFSNFGASGAIGSWEWWRKKYSEESAVKVVSIDANNGNLETIGEVKGATGAITGNASVGGNLSVTGGVSGSGGTLASTQLNSYKIDDDSSPIATRSSGLVNAGQRSSLFSVYKPITVAFSSGSTSSFYLQVYRNGSYYNVLTNANDAVSLNPGRYAFYNFSGSDSISVDIACVGAYGTADGSSIWS